MSDISELATLQAVLAGRYSIEREIGRGGMGIVFLARDVALERPVAIKLLPPQFGSDEIARERFVREARTAAKLSHPNIVPIFLVEAHGELVFFVMAFVEGETLTDRVRRTGPLNARDGGKLIQEVAWGLAYAHQVGIVHRDVKPDNILIESGSGRAMITDFGIAGAADAGSETGEIVGTPQFLSPEQASGTAVDGRSDIYSLGATAFFALSGRAPFDGQTALALLTQHVTQPAPPLLSIRPTLPAKLAQAVDRCLAKQAAERFESGESLAEAIANAQPMVAEVPPLVRAFVRDVQMSKAEMSGALIAYILLAGARPESGLLPAFLGLVALSRLVRSARRVAKEGYDFAAARRALLAEADAEHAERMAIKGTFESPEEERRRMARAPKDLRRAGWSAAAFGITLLGFGTHVDSNGIEFEFSTLLTQTDVTRAPLASVAVLAFAGLTMFFLLRSPAQPAAGRSNWWVRLFAGRAGHLLFGLASIGVKPAEARIAPSVKRTELLLAESAALVVSQLPREMQDQLGNTFVTIAGLQHKIELLREVESGTSNEAVTSLRVAGTGALENIRLQLLRVRAGASADGVTAVLARAEAIGRLIDDYLVEVRRTGS